MTTPRFHINPDTGRPNSCRATKRCPFGGEDKHYGSKDEARAAYESQMEENLLAGKSNNDEARNPTPPTADTTFPVRTDEERRVYQEAMRSRLHDAAFQGGGDAFLDTLDHYETTLEKAVGADDSDYQQTAGNYLDELEKTAKSRQWFDRGQRMAYLNSLQGLRHDVESGTMNSLPQWKADQIQSREALNEQMRALGHRSHFIINEEWIQARQRGDMSPIGDSANWNEHAAKTLHKMREAATISPHWKNEEEKQEWMNKHDAIRDKLNSQGAHHPRGLGSYDTLRPSQKIEVDEYIDRNDVNWGAYYAATEKKHFGGSSTPGSTFTDPRIRGLDDVLARASDTRGSLAGDDKEKLIALGSDPHGFSDDKRYIMVKTGGTVGVKNTSDFSDDTPLTVTRTKPGVPCSLVAEVDNQPTSDYGVIVVNRAKMKRDPHRVITAFPGPVTKPLDNAEVDAMEGKTLTVGEARKLLGEDVFVNTRVRS